MRTDGSLVGTRWGPISAIGPQPHRRHENEVWAGTPTRPWGSRRLPRTLAAGDRRRVLFRELLRRAEGVPVEFADGETGTVERIVFPVLGFEFWPSDLVVATRHGRRRVPRAAVVQIDVHEPRILVAASSRQPLGRGSADRTRDAATWSASLASRVGTISSRPGGSPRRHRRKPEAPVGRR
jgi:hypothetical protein